MNLILRIRGRHVDGQGPTFRSSRVAAAGPRLGLVRLVIVVAGLAGGGCGVSNKPQAPEGSAVVSSTVSNAAVDASAPDAADALNVCGCSLCKPVVSDDACDKDSDCGPSAACHATACVARAKAKPREPGTMCTMILACNSTDANDCGCVKNRCTLSPRAAK